MIDEITGDGTKVVRVATPCTCKAQRWFYCECSEVVAEYDVAVLDGVPLDEHINFIMGEHPGMDLVY